MKLSEITVGTRHRKDLGDISALAASLAAVGLLHPPILNSAGELIAGERRVAAARSLGWQEIEVRTLDNLDEITAALRAEQDENTCRKDFTPTEAAAMARALQPAFEAAAAERKATPNSEREKFTPSDKGKSADKVAEAVGMSRPTLEKAQAVVAAAEADPEHYGDLPQKMDDTGRVDPVFKEAQARAVEHPIPDVPKIKPKPELSWEWPKAIRTIYETFSIVDKKGGIEALVDEWQNDRPDLIEDYLRTLRDVRARCDKFIPVLQRRLKCKRRSSTRKSSSSSHASAST
jgi:hypothetical protein